MIAITPRQLEVFVAVAASGGVRAAAERLHLSQPAVSMALAEFERLLGVRVFDRHRRRLVLNERGREFLPLAHDTLDRLREFGQRAHTDTPAGELALGASNTIGNYLVADLIGGFAAAHPGVRLRLTVGNTEGILAGVLDFSLDVGCVEGPVAHPSIEVLPWRSDELVVCARPDHPLAARRRLAARDFIGQRWILREPGSATRSVFEHAAAGRLGAFDVALELGQSEAIKQAVLAGLGIACLPRVALDDALASGRLVVLPTPFLDLRRTLTLVVHRARQRGANIRTFLAAALPRRAPGEVRLSAAAARSRGRGTTRNRSNR